MTEKDNNTKKAICKVEWCDVAVRSNGYCKRHDAQVRRHGKYVKTEMDGAVRQERKCSSRKERKCSLEGCNNKHAGNGFCLKHFKQMQKHGKTTLISESTPNEVTWHTSYCEMTMYDRHNFPKNEKAIFDKEDYTKVMNIRWGFNGKYVMNKDIGTFHTKILGVKEGLFIDHINGDTLDNRKKNLRHCTEEQNNQNSKMFITNKSGFKGVSWDKKDKTWVSQMSKKNKSKRIGNFENKIDAARAYDEAILKERGEFAVTNKMMGLL